MNTPSEQQETGKLHNGKAHRYEFREQDRHTHPPIQKEKKKKNQVTLKVLGLAQLAVA